MLFLSKASFEKLSDFFLILNFNFIMFSKVSTGNLFSSHFRQSDNVRLQFNSSVLRLQWVYGNQILTPVPRQMKRLIQLCVLNTSVYVSFLLPL